MHLIRRFERGFSNFQTYESESEEKLPYHLLFITRVMDKLLKAGYKSNKHRYNAHWMGIKSLISKLYDI